MAVFDTRTNVQRRRLINKLAGAVFFVAVLVGLIALVMLLADILRKGFSWVDWQFVTSYASRFPERAGIKAAIAGSLWMMAITAPVSFILGVGTALYLEEYAERNWFTRLVQTNITNLAGVPSIVFGILGLGIFVNMFAMGRSIIAGALTMSLLILPIIVVAAQEALRAIPNSLRNASYALGATRWQTIRRVVLPAAMPSILTGTILALSRAIGETAPLIVVGAVAFIRSTPSSPFDPFTVLPIQIYNWTARPQAEFHELAAAGIIVLLAILLLMNAFAVWLRNKFQSRF
ncbi:phosphate ABC transporter permease PstA [Bacillaceae bacterium]